MKNIMFKKTINIKIIIATILALVFSLFGGASTSLAVSFTGTNGAGLGTYPYWYTTALTETVGDVTVDWVLAETIGYEYCNGNYYLRTYEYNYQEDTWIAGASDTGIYLSGCGAEDYIDNSTNHQIYGRSNKNIYRTWDHP